MDKKIIILRVVSIILLIATAVAIFAFSAQPAKESKKTSGGVAKKICEIFYPGFKNKTYFEQTKIIRSIQKPVRKAAHMTVYAVLAFFAFLSAVSFKGIPFYLRLLISYVFCILYSVSDEIHQVFVPGRAGRIGDVIVDLIGVTITTTVMLYVFKKTYFFRGLRDE